MVSNEERIARRQRTAAGSRREPAGIPGDMGGVRAKIRSSRNTTGMG